MDDVENLTEDGDAFEYDTRLNAEEIRVLEPVHISDTQLSFNILDLPRRWKPKYTAISYAWGKEKPDDVVYLNSISFQVRPNLWSCLYYLCTSRKRGRWKYIWVDAICINQQDDDEKSAQVSTMDITYRQAACVSVWLGLPPGTRHHSPSTRASEMTLEAEAVSPKRNSLETAWKALSERSSAVPLFSSQLSTREKLIFNNSAIYDLANRSYWTRRWVIQEFLLNDKVFVHCGDASLIWSDFRWLVEKIRPFDNVVASFDNEHYYNARATTASNEPAASFLLDQKIAIGRQDGWDLFRLLHEFNHAECGDPRDRVFALLSLVSNGDGLRRRLPDYSLSMDEVVEIIIRDESRAWYRDEARTFWYGPRIVRATLGTLGYSSSTNEYCDNLMIRADPDLLDPNAHWLYQT